MKKINYLIILALTLTACSVESTKQNDFKYFDSSKLYYIKDSLKNEMIAQFHFINGLTNYNTNNYSMAILDFFESSKLKESPVTYLAIAKSYGELNKITPAIEYIDKALKIDQKYVPAISYLNKIYFELLNMDGVKNTLEWKAEIMPSLQNLGELALFYTYFDLEKAEKLYLEMIQKNDDIYLYLKLLEIYSKLDKKEKANEILKILRDKRSESSYKFEIYNSLLNFYTKNLINKEFSSTLKELDNEFEKWEIEEILKSVFEGILLEITTKKNNSKEIKEIIEAVLDFSNERNFYTPTIYFYLGFISSTIDNHDITEKYYIQYISLNEDNFAIFQEIFRYYYVNKKQAELLSNLLLNSTKYPDELVYPYFSGILYYEMDSIEQSKECFLKAIKIDSNNVEILTQLGLVNHILKRYEESDEYYEKALILDPENPLANNNYAYSLSERGLALERALVMIKIAIEIDSQNPNYLDTYGWIYFQTGNNEKALEYLEKSKSIDSTNADVWLHIGDVLKNQGKELEAIKAWEKGIIYDPQNSDLLDRIKK
ncbi:MAG TPA: tetratricopeptide repeat protein [Candidatus Kapabacteria bacterium]|nr:tetratricopeptide repeat protein [Candidatus Kapabacteria bacterium]HPO62203.1 tetratricopeptide repeat protein [Candidatus Kapabacteria bacterium]